jgi:hypothetical protein
MRYGNKTRSGSQVADWLPGIDGRIAFPKVLATTITTAVADSVAHTKGAWTEVIASADDDYDGVIVMPFNNLSTNARQSLFDIGIGASGSEVVVVANSVAGATSTNGYGANRGEYYYPVSIPKGSRVAFRVQSVATSVSVQFTSAWVRTGFSSPSSLVTYGANTATSRGTNLPTDDTYVELVASTAEEFQGLVGVPLIATNNTVTAEVTYTVGIGPSGSETVLDTFLVRSQNTETGGYAFAQYPFVYYGKIPAGSRLAVKQSTGATTRDVILHGIPVT